MEHLSAIVAAGKFFLEVASKVRAAFRSRRKGSPGAIELGTLLELYGCAVRLTGYSAQVRRIFKLAPDQVSDADRRMYYLFVREIRLFARCVCRMDLCILDIYYPGLGQHISRSIIGDMFVLTWARDLAEQYGMSATDIPELADAFYKWTTHGQVEFSTFNALWGEPQYSVEGKDPQTMLDIPHSHEVRQALLELMTTLDECRGLIGEVVRENWGFRELTASPKDEQDHDGGS